MLETSEPNSQVPVKKLLKATIKDVQSKTKVRRNGQKYYYNRTVRGSLEPSKIGQEVYMKPDKNTKGKKVPMVSGY